MSYLVMLAAR
ncbi:hypothetical protein BsWGS_29094 [Bradybaena similaris]